MEKVIESSHAVGGIVISLLLVLVVTWIAAKKGYFRLPSQSRFHPLTLLQVAGAFLTYLIFAFLVVPAAHFLIALLITGEVRSLKEYSTSWLTSVQVISLTLLFFVLIAYCFLIKREARHQIFWGNGVRSFSRFIKSVAMGMLSWVISYPFVLLMSLLANLVAYWVWGDIKVEQVAVKQLKGTINDPLLFALMIVVVVLLVPFMEELLFRGFLQNLVKKYLGRWWAIFITAAIFALVHFSKSQGLGNFQLILSLFVLSFFLGFIYERQRNLWAPIALHITFNGFSALFIAFNS